MDKIQIQITPHSARSLCNYNVRPHLHVHISICSDAEHVVAGNILHQLLREANGVSVIFAVVLDTGHVLLEEYADASHVLFKNKVPVNES